MIDHKYEQHAKAARATLAALEHSRSYALDETGERGLIAAFRIFDSTKQVALEHLGWREAQTTVIHGLEDRIRILLVGCENLDQHHLVHQILK